MIDFQNGSYVKLRKVSNGDIGKNLESLLLADESIIGVYKGIRDYVVFTDKRVIAANVQGITGKKQDFTSMPYKKISVFSIETSGVFDLDAANLVTIYDVAVQNFLMTAITEEIPNAYFIAEEKENDPDVLNREYCFIIDPIDGTANFAHEYRHSCISLALFSCGEAVFAAVYDPYQDELFSARKGEGAFLNGKPIRVAERDFAHSIVAFGTSPYYKNTLGEKTFKLAHTLYMQCSDLRRSGSAALDLAYLAAGRNDIFFECVLSPWDIAAGYLLITEAGGVITDMDGNKISFAAPSPVIASTPKIYDDLLNVVKSL